MIGLLAFHHHTSCIILYALCTLLSICSCHIPSKLHRLVFRHCVMTRCDNTPHIPSLSITPSTHSPASTLSIVPSTHSHVPLYLSPSLLPPQHMVLTEQLLGILNLSTIDQFLSDKLSHATKGCGTTLTTLTTTILTTILPLLLLLLFLLPFLLLLLIPCPHTSLHHTSSDMPFNTSSSHPPLLDHTHTF